VLGLKLHHIAGVGIEYEPTDSGKKKLASSLFEFDTDQQTVSRKKSIRPGTDGRFIEHKEMKYTKEEVDSDIREGDFFSFRDQAILREQELPKDDRFEFCLFCLSISIITVVLGLVLTDR